jgi:hypothetical protein
METISFSHNGKDYEIRVICDGETVYVKSFYDNNPVNRFRYSATIEKIHVFSEIIGMNAVKHLIDIAKNDIIAGIK